MKYCSGVHLERVSLKNENSLWVKVSTCRRDNLVLFRPFIFKFRLNKYWAELSQVKPQRLKLREGKRRLTKSMLGMVISRYKTTCPVRKLVYIQSHKHHFIVQCVSWFLELLKKHTNKKIRMKDIFFLAAVDRRSHARCSLPLVRQCALRDITQHQLRVTLPGRLNYWRTA